MNKPTILDESTTPPAKPEFPKAWKLLKFSQLHLPFQWTLGVWYVKCRIQPGISVKIQIFFAKNLQGMNGGSLFRKLGGESVSKWSKYLCVHGYYIYIYTVYQKHVSISIFWISYCFILKAPHREIKFIPLSGEWNLHDLWISGCSLLWEDSDEHHRHNPKITIRRSETYTFTLRKKYSSLTIVFLKNCPKTPSVEGSPTPNFSLETPNFVSFRHLETRRILKLLDH